MEQNEKDSQPFRSPTVSRIALGGEDAHSALLVLLVSASGTRLQKKVLRHCEQGYRPIAVVYLWAGQAEVVMERPTPTSEPIEPDVCGAQLSLAELHLQEKPDTDTKSEYLRLGPAKLTELLDSIAAAYDDGFRVVSISVDSGPENQNTEPDASALLERQEVELDMNEDSPSERIPAQTTISDDLTP